MRVSSRLAGGAACLALVASGTAARATSCPPARVTALSYVLDVMESGSGAGPSVVYGVATTVLSGEQLPGPLGQAQQDLLTAGAKGVVAMSAAGPRQIEKLRAQVALLAAYNTQANAVVSALSGGMTRSADLLGTAIAPFDVTLRQMAATVAQLKEPPPTHC